MKIAIYDPSAWKDAADADAHGALYTTPSPLTYDGITGIADHVEVISMCMGYAGLSAQIVIDQGNGWEKYSHDTDL